MGLSDEYATLEQVTPETEAQALQHTEIKILFDLCKYSIQEFCSNYVPMIVSTTITTNNLEYPISSLTNYLRVKGVYRDNQPIKFKIINRNFVFDEDGTYEIEYASYPVITSLFTNVDFTETVSLDVITLGLCAYYSLAKGMYDDFKNYLEEYKSRAENIKEIRIFNTPLRSWQ